MTNIPGLWGSLAPEIDDPSSTDELFNISGTTSWTHTLAPGSYTTGNLTFLTAEIDIAGPYDVFVD